MIPEVIIINPPRPGSKRLDFDPASRPRQPLDLLYIQALIKKITRCEFIDACALRKSPREVINYINKVKPKIVILTSTPLDRWECPYLTIDEVFEIINGVKNSKTILCGSHGTITPDWIFKKAKVDYLVRGEPEITVKKLVEAILSKKSPNKIDGISFKRASNSKIIHNLNAPVLRDLDELPFPAYEDIDFNLYQYTSDDIPTPFTIMLTSRACPFRCTYCFKGMMALPYRTREPKKVIDELTLLQNRFGVRGVFFQDWEFMVKKEHVKEICKLIIKKRLKIKWGCNGRAPDFSNELLTLMKKAGCVRVNIGFESGSQKILDNIEKLTTVTDNLRAIKIARKIGINIGTYGLINAPGENLFTLHETAKFLVKNKLEGVLWWNVPIPYFGTKLYKTLGKDLTDWKQLSDYTGRVNTIFSPNFSKLILNFFIILEKYGYAFLFNKKFWVIVTRRVLSLPKQG